MSKSLFKDYIYPIAVYAGGMIGVGFLALPYIAMQVGAWWMILCFVVITVLTIVLNIIFCEISLKTPDFKRLPGFAGYHLGSWAEVIMMFSMVVGLLGVLLVYLIVGGQFLTSILQPMFSGTLLIYTLIYFFIASVIIYFDIKVVARVELWVLTLLFISLLLVFVEGTTKMKLSNIIFTTSNFNAQNLFLPYGALLFSLWGAALIPEIEEMLLVRKKLLKRVIITATIIVAALYVLFTFLIVGITGKMTQQTALPGLKWFLPNTVVLVSLLAGVLATLAAFITQGILLKKTLIFDLKIKNWQAFVITCFTPMILLLMGLKSFIPLVSLIGGVLVGLDGIVILMIYKKIGGRNIIIYPLSLIFLFGVVYEIVYFIR